MLGISRFGAHLAGPTRIHDQPGSQVDLVHALSLTSFEVGELLRRVVEAISRGRHESFSEIVLYAGSSGAGTVTFTILQQGSDFEVRAER